MARRIDDLPPAAYLPLSGCPCAVARLLPATLFQKLNGDATTKLQIRSNHRFAVSVGHHFVEGRLEYGVSVMSEPDITQNVAPLTNVSVWFSKVLSANAKIPLGCGLSLQPKAPIYLIDGALTLGPRNL